MPKLFTVSGYTVYFWSNENGEPIHVHVSKGKPTPNATKIWLTKSGGCILASNGSKILNKELNELLYTDTCYKQTRLTWVRSTLRRNKIFKSRK